MKHFIILIIFLGSLFFANAQPYTFIRQIGSALNDEINFVKLCNDGGIVISVNADTIITTGTGPANYSGAFIAKLDAVGNTLWAIPAAENNVGFPSYIETRMPGIAV